MKRLPIVVLIAGLLMLGVQRYYDFRPETLPLPGNGLTVRMSIVVRSSGDYYLVVSMPRADNALALVPETISCEFTFSATSPGYEAIEDKIISLGRHSEIGFSNIQLYQSQPWHLNA